MKKLLLVGLLLILNSCDINLSDRDYVVVAVSKASNSAGSYKYHVQTDSFGLYTYTNYSIGDTITFKKK